MQEFIYFLNRMSHMSEKRNLKFENIGQLIILVF